MNLIHDQWIPVIRIDGGQEMASPQEISDPEIINIATVRPDFNAALHQFLIGLCQTACMPESMTDWEDKWKNPPDQDFLQSRFEKIAPFFEIDAAGPAFMQDFNLPKGETKPINALLIEAPGDKTIRDNLDHFIKGGQVEHICRSCAASALFTLQTNAPSGGAGHRTGLRGGGPLSTLLMPCENDGPASLWQRMWLNVFPRDELKNFTGEIKLRRPEAIFPWLGETRTSEKTGVDTFPENAHPLQMYWGMPRRIRLEFSGDVTGPCDLCGRTDGVYATGFCTKNYGINYAGPWVHPLSPYNHDPKKEKPPLPAHAQKGGVSYRHWLGLIGAYKKSIPQPAEVVRHYLEQKSKVIDAAGEARLWACGYDMDNMKARCWYDSVMPVYPIPEKKQEFVTRHAHDLIEIAKKTAGDTRKAIKNAWFRRPQDKKGEFFFVSQAFWQNTESAFYDSLYDLIHVDNEETVVASTRENWGKTLMHQAFQLFDQYALSGLVEDGDMKRVVEARNELGKWLGAAKKKLTGRKK